MGRAKVEPLPLEWAPQVRFDTFVTALATAKAGVGVMLGILPLCAAECEAGALKRVTDQAMPQDASYYLIRNGKLASR